MAANITCRPCPQTKNHSRMLWFSANLIFDYASQETPAVLLPK